MRNSVVLRFVSAAALALVAGTAMSSPAAAFVGLSDKQANHIKTIIKCETYLLKWDLQSFEADPDCGGKGGVTESLTYGTSGGTPQEEPEHCYPDYETYSVKSIRECPVPG